MPSAEAARKIPLRFSGRADVVDSGAPARLRPAVGGNNGCEFGNDCLVKPDNWPAFHQWILRSVASLIPDKLSTGPVKRWELLRSAPDPENVAQTAGDCRKCCLYIDKVVEITALIRAGKIKT